jgi:hypothetical protein
MAAISGNAWGRARKQKMKHPQCDQEDDQGGTNDVISIQTTHGSFFHVAGGGGTGRRVRRLMRGSVSRRASNMQNRRRPAEVMGDGFANRDGASDLSAGCRTRGRARPRNAGRAKGMVDEAAYSVRLSLPSLSCIRSVRIWCGKFFGRSYSARSS